jgi:CheY-like chemotaxis protein
MLSPTSRPAVLLIADDDLDMRQMFRALMTARGHRVLEAADGAECIGMLLGSGVDLVVLDLRMPGMDGFTLAAQLRSDEATRHLPLLAVTALADAGAAGRALAAGCNAVMVKPFSPRLLMEQVEALLDQSLQPRPI